jgi:ParB family chromosome partitioning protein
LGQLKWQLTHNVPRGTFLSTKNRKFTGDSKMNVAKKGRVALGRGLSALISSTPVNIRPTSEVQDDNSGAVANSPQGDTPQEPANPRFLDRDLIIPNPAQPRKVFEEKDLAELAESIKTLGVLQPVMVRPAKGENQGKYEIVAGERRWRASERAGLSQVPVIIRDLTDLESLEIALVENVQRANLNPIEEAKGYQNLMDQFSLGQQEVADRVGKDRATVANILRIIKLPDEVQALISSGALSLGHAKALLSVKDGRAQVSFAKKAVEEALSVRALETLVSQSAPLDGSKRAAMFGLEEGIAGKNKKGGTAFPDIVDQLRRKLGTKVMIRHQNNGRGRIEIEYFSEAELGRIVESLAV